MIDAWGPQEVAAHLGVATATVAKWRQRGVIPQPESIVSGVPLWTSSTIQTWAAATGRQAAAGPSS